MFTINLINYSDVVEVKVQSFLHLGISLDFISLSIPSCVWVFFLKKIIPLQQYRILPHPFVSGDTSGSVPEFHPGGEGSVTLAENVVRLQGQNVTSDAS